MFFMHASKKGVVWQTKLSTKKYTSSFFFDLCQLKPMQIREEAMIDATKIILERPNPK